MKKCPFVPLYDRVAFEEVINESLIHVPNGMDAGGEKRLIVIDVGPGRLVNGENVPLSVKVGDRITLTADAMPRLSAHKVGPKETDVIFSVQESFIAGIYK